MSYKLGSLFDGSGGFPLAGSMCGIEPVWASEVESYPIAVTRSRFPGMKHLGSVTDVLGGDIEPVDIITFGSPCQDLSIAGKQAGLKHTENGDEETTRSGLFMEAVRIIREMREATNGRYPTFALWENVPGAFSSNNGEDFRTVLEELIKIVEPSAVMPEVPKNGWPYADSYCGDGWSLAYRVLDAQYWGVPQRRRRIYLVADFRGQRAGEVLFEREGLRGYFAEGRTPWQGIAGDAADCAGADDCEGMISYTLKIRSGCEGGGKGALIQEDKSATPATNNDQYLFQPIAYSFDSLASNSMKSKNPYSGCRQVEVGKTLYTTDPNPSKNQGGIAVVACVYENGAGTSEKKTVCYPEKAHTLSARADGSPQLDKGSGANIVCYAAAFKAGQGAKSRSIGFEEECSPTLAAEAGGNSVPSVCIKEQYLFENHSQDFCYRGPLDICPMLPAQLGTGGNNQPFMVEESPVYCLQGNGIDRADTAGCNGKGWRENECYTLNTIDRPAVAYCMAHGQANAEICEEKSPCLNCNHEQPIVFDKEVYNSGINATGGHYISDRGIASSLRTGCPPGVCIRYIVRRLTPTECARLQGFPDSWGHPDPKEDFSDEEYRFWLNARNTHAEINGKTTKEYTKAQMLTWYNKLHTDSSEYKMWGNGIALPCALYVMQGIAEAMKNNSKTEG